MASAISGRRGAFACLLAGTALAGIFAGAPAASAADPTFAPAASYFTGSISGPGPAPVGSVTADWDNDGDADLATVDLTSLSGPIAQLNNGDGEFPTKKTVSGAIGVQALAAGDVTGDGRADLVGMTISSIVIMRGNGNGTFSVVRSFSATLGGQLNPILGDFDEDGDLDIAAPTFTYIQTWKNNGSGGFTVGPPAQPQGAGVMSAITKAKINADGHIDLYAVDGLFGRIYALTGNGDGTFNSTGNLPLVGFIPEDVAAGDLNGDGFDDVGAVGSFSFTLATGLADGSGGFATSSQLQFGGAGPTSLAIADFNRDGNKDVVVSDVANPLRPAMVMFTGDGTVKPKRTGSFVVTAFPQTPVVADYDRDGRLDIATHGPLRASVLINRTP
ncbi:MAG: VCBS repeat-containing protein [Solirubrobacteraceae bacterium]|nr:VCBS repeat-containing protein [Solirubrobacteraceae bacterium]